jgi:pantothenate kinase
VIRAEPARLPELVTRAAGLAARGRGVLGITGPPGAGKSALAAALADELPAVVVPMDGFHLADAELLRLGRLERKGAPDTFDASGYLALLRRLRAGRETLRAPAFDRAREQTIAEAILVPRETGLVVTEGNYLLLEVEPWCGARDALDEVWFLDDPRRVERLVARHVAHGTDPAEAYARATLGSDGDNARLIVASRHRADLVLEHGWLTA